MAEWLNEAASTFWRANIPVAHRREAFRSTFGCDPEICVEIWRALMISGAVPPATHSIHVMWMLFFFRHYNIGTVNANRVGVTERTFRDKVLGLADALGPLAPLFVRLKKNFDGSE